VRETKSDPNRWTADRADSEAEVLPKFGAGLAPSRSAFEELRKYPFFFADDDDEPTQTAPTPVAHADMARSATVPPIPAPPAAIRPLLAQIAPTETRVEVPSKPVAPLADTAVPTPASLAERHAAAIARKQAAPVMPPAAPVQTLPIEPIADYEEVAPAPRAARATPASQEQEAWYSRVPTGISLVAVIAYFLIGGVALIGTGLVLGGLGGTLMALFGLVVTAVAAYAAWQELTNARG